MVDGATANCPGSVPVPLEGAETAGFDPLELMRKLPAALPADCGANEALNVTLCAADNVSGRLIPLKLNPVPLGVIWEIVRAEPPEFVSVSASVELLPVATLPKPKFAGFAVSWPGVTPVPDSGTFRAKLEAFEVIARLPLTLLPEVGANLILTATLWPTLKVIGKLNPLALNPEPIALAPEIVTFAAPEFVRVSASVWELPT